MMAEGKAKTWYECKAAEKNEPAEIFIFDAIGGFDLNAASFIKDFKAISDGGQDVVIRINSPGGSVTEGNAIYNAIQRAKGDVTVTIEGIAASIASVVALAGNRVLMAKNSMFMIHNPFTFSMGDAKEMRKIADTLDKFQDNIILAYAEKTGKDIDTITDWMDAETWFTASEALTAGFVDGTTESIEAFACHDLAGYKYQNVPKAYQETSNFLSLDSDVITGTIPSDTPGLMTISATNTTTLPYIQPAASAAGGHKAGDDAQNTNKETDMTKPDFSALTTDTLQAERPDLCAELVNAHDETAIKAERSRVSLILANKYSHQDEIAAKLIEDGTDGATALATLIQDQKEHGAKKVEDLKAGSDAAVGGVDFVGEQEAVDDGSVKAEELGDRKAVLEAWNKELDRVKTRDGVTNAAATRTLQKENPALFAKLSGQ